MEKKEMNLNGKNQLTRGLFSGIKHNFKMHVRRLFSVILCASLVAGSMPVNYITALASENDSDDADYVYEIDGISFAKAVQKAVSDGDYLENEIKFLGEASETYDELFEPDGSLYELNWDSLGVEKDKDREKDLKLRVFTRITKDIPLDEAYEIDGEEDILFLLQNKTDDEVSVSIYMDGRESEIISIPAAGDIEVSFDSDSDIDDEDDMDLEDEDNDDDAKNPHDDDEGRRGFAGGRNNGNGSSGGRGNNAATKRDKTDALGEDKDSAVKDNKGSDKTGNEPADITGKGTDKESDNKAEEGKEKDKNSASEGRNEESGKESNKPDDNKSDSVKESGNRNTDGKGSNSKDSNNNTNSKESNNRNSGNNDQGSSVGSSNNTNGSKNSNKGNGTSDSGSSNDNEKTDKQSKGEKTASISAHSGNLLAAAIASESDAEKASPSDASNIIEGTIYDPVRIGRRGAVAFVTNTENLGLSEVDLSGIVSDAEIYNMSLDALCDAVEYEVNEGEPLEEDDEGYLYEISPELEEEAERLALRTFVKINKTHEESEEVEIADSEEESGDPSYIEEVNDENSYFEIETGYVEYSGDGETDNSYDSEDQLDSTVYYVTGEEEIYFLLTNETDEAVIARIQIAASDDVYETERLVVPGNGMVEVSDSEKDEDYGIMFLETVNEDTDTYDDGYIADADIDDEYAYDDGCTAMEGTVYEEVSDDGEPEVVYVTTLGNLGVNYGIKLLADGDVGVTVDGTETLYASLSEAIDAANAATGTDVTVTLYADVTETVAETYHFTISRGMTFDLNEHTIYVTGTNTSSSTWRFFAIADSNLDLVTFCNGTVDGHPEGAAEAANSDFLYASNTGTAATGANYWHHIKLENLTVQNFGAPPTTNITYIGTVYVSGTDLTVENCTFQNNEMRGITVASKWATKGYTHIVIENSTFTKNNNNSSAVYTNIAYTSPQTYENGAYAGAFFIRYADQVDIKNNTIKENSAELTGGGFFIYYSENIDIEENEISGNYTRLADLGDRTTTFYNYSSGGGGFTIHGPIGDNVVVKNNKITDNSAYSFGGGFMILHEDDVTHETYYSGDISIDSNTITGNTVLPFTDKNGDKASHGGGIALYDLERLYDTDEDNYSQVTLTNNKISNNIAGSGTSDGGTINRGGGISLYSATPNAGYKEKLEYVIESGEISGNTADVGGGIDLTIGDDTLLQLYNTSITGNTAVRGGGMWTNPSSVTDMNVTDGAVIYNNTASGSFDGYAACGDDIRHEGSDSDLLAGGELTGTDAVTELDSELTILNLDLDQANENEYSWYTDEIGMRYSTASDPDELLVDFEGANSLTISDSVSLHADLDADGADPDVKISDNTAWAYGGGIASDATIYFGDSGSTGTHEAEVNVKDETTGTDQDYDTLAEAVAAANQIAASDDVTITLNKSITVDLDTEVEESSVIYAQLTRGATIDLNGKSISIEGNHDDEHDHDKHLLDIKTSGEVTIKNGTISGRVRAAGSTMGYAIHSEGSADACNNLVIDTVKISSFGDPEYGTIYAKYTNLTIKDSTISDNETRAFYFVGGTNADRAASLTVVNCTFSLNKPVKNDHHYGGAFYAEYATSVVVKDSTISENGGSISDNSGAGSNYLYGGGGFYLSHCGTDSEVSPVSTDGDDNITISGNTVHLNRAYSDDIKHLTDSTWEKVGGGGFKLYDVAGYVKITNNTVDSNHAYAFGGGISIQDDSYSTNASSQHLGNIDILDNEITSNTLYCYDPNANAHGGGIAVFDTAYTHGDDSIVITFTGNKINENTSGIKQHNSSPINSFQSKGGGVALCAYDDETEFRFYSGEILNNQACSGGGVDCTFKQSSTVRFYNTVITENESKRGGGIWLCPTADFYIYETFGGAIYNNTASGTISYGSDSYPACGDDIRYEGNDSDAMSRLWNDQQEYNDWIAAGMPTEATVTSRALGGELYDWYTDGQHALYNGSNPYTSPATERYNNVSDKDDLYVPLETILKQGVRNTDGTWDGYHKRSGSFSLHSELSEHAISLANDECTVLISGNTATYYGGGVAANTAITFGYELDEDLKLLKTFKNTDGTAMAEEDLPEYVKVTLVRVDEDGSEEELETVQLNADNEWTYTFYELEHYYETVGDDDEINWHKWDYRVKEVAVKEKGSDEEDKDPDKSWAQKYVVEEKDEDNDGNIDLIEVSLTNTHCIEPVLTKEELEDDYERKGEDIEHDDENGEFEENIDGDGWGSWDDADNNQEITYRLTLDHIKDVHEMVIHDYLEEGLTFEPDTVNIILHENSNDTTGRVLIKGESSQSQDYEYYITQGTCSDDGEPKRMEDCTFEVHFAEWLFDPELKDPDSIEPAEALDDGAYVVITYNAITETHPEDYFDEEHHHEYEDVILNDAYATGYYGYWSDDGQWLTMMSFRTMPISTETYLFGFGIFKYATSNGEEIGLEGAEFMLSEQELLKDGSRGATHYATFESEADADVGDAYMVTGWVEDIDSADILTSGSDGMIRIEGLDDDTYTLTETKAPSGYETMAESFTIVIDEYGSITVNGLTGSKELTDGHVVYVENLPSDESKPVTGDLTISKNVTGSGASTTTDFNFTLELSGGESGKTYNVIDVNGNVIGQITFDDSGKATYEFTLKDGESITVKDLPEGIEYTITETDSDGYTVTITGATGTESSSGFGTVTSDGVNVTFTNSRGSTTTTTTHHGSSGGGGGSTRSGGSTTGGPGTSDGGPEGEDDTWDLQPLPPTGESNKMVFGITALAISAMALVILLWYRRRSTNKE